MRRLLMADVHANLPAFRAVLQDAGPVDETIFLGDVVGCGPHPCECVDLLQSLDAKAVVGNHDLAVLAKSPMLPSASVQDWDAWTRLQLQPAHVEYLQSLPTELRLVLQGVQATLVHRPKDSRYLHPAMPEELLAESLRQVSSLALCCGHSHRWINRLVGGRLLICLPSVGQPRNGDPRAGYVLEDDGQLDVRYVQYDVQTVIGDIERIGLPLGYMERWRSFLTTGFDSEWSREWVQ
jgi:predicted phosphodiesterase